MAHATDYDAPWTLGEAMTLIDALRGPLKKVGFAIGLTGSVLIHRKSEHDVDLVLYPLTTALHDVEAARGVLRAASMRCIVDKQAVHALWKRIACARQNAGRDAPDADTKHVEVWTTPWADEFGKQIEKRVDIFFLS